MIHQFTHIIHTLLLLTKFPLKLTSRQPQGYWVNPWAEFTVFHYQRNFIHYHSNNVFESLIPPNPERGCLPFIDKTRAIIGTGNTVRPQYQRSVFIGDTALKTQTLERNVRVVLYQFDNFFCVSRLKYLTIQPIFIQSLLDR